MVLPLIKTTHELVHNPIPTQKWFFPNLKFQRLFPQLPRIQLLIYLNAILSAIEAWLSQAFAYQPKSILC